MATSMETATTGVASAGVKGARQFQGLFSCIPFTFTIEEDSIAASAASTADITVPGAELGDFVLVTGGIDMVNIVMTAFVASAGVVTIQLQNQEVSDAATTLATVHTANGVVLKPNDNVIDWGP